MTQTRQAGVVALPDDDGAMARVQRFVSRLQPEIARALPKGMNADRVARIALTLVRQSELQAQKDNKPGNSLARCDFDSFAGSLLTASALGLEPGINQEAYLVPYKRECTLIVGYQGYVKLFWQHPEALYIDAHAVRDRDAFDYEYGIDQFLRHKPARGDRGEIVRYWAAAKLASGGFRFVVLEPDEIKDLRGGREGPSGSIADPQHWMERKTALRQLLKLLPKSTTMAAALAVDEQRGSVLASREVPASITAQEPIAELPPIEATLVEDTPRVTAADITRQQAVTPPKPASKEQLAKLHAALAQCGVSEAERHDTLSTIIGRTITSASELSMANARTVIDVLERCALTDDPATALGVCLAEAREAGA